MASTHSKPPHLRVIQGGKFPPFVRSKAQVLLSELEHGGQSRTMLRELAVQIRAKVSFLETQLADDAKNLRAGLQSFLKTMASSRKDELSGSGVDFRDPSDPTRVAVRLVNGETDTPAAQSKIDDIIDSCVEVANSDVEFMRGILVSIRDKGSIPKDQFTQLKAILENNSYWRFVEPT